MEINATDSLSAVSGIRARSGLVYKNVAYEPEFVAVRDDWIIGGGTVDLVKVEAT